MDSILTSIKKLLGIAEDYKHFDDDIIMHINSVFSILTQLGVGPEKGFSIKDETSVWTDFVPENPRLESIKTYVYMKVRLIFDPPISSAVMDSMKQCIAEFEWRLNHEVESSQSSGEEEIQNE